MKLSTLATYFRGVLDGESGGPGESDFEPSDDFELIWFMCCCPDCDAPYFKSEEALRECIKKVPDLDCFIALLADIRSSHSPIQSPQVDASPMQLKQNILPAGWQN